MPWVSTRRKRIDSTVYSAIGSTVGSSVGRAMSSSVGRSIVTVKLTVLFVSIYTVVGSMLKKR